MFFGHIDRFITEPGAALWDASGNLCAKGILECKSAHAFARNQWGEAGSDQMPAAYLLQVVWYLALTGCEQATVAVLLGNQALTYYEVRRDPELEALVLSKAKAFWDQHIVAGVPPAAKGLDDVRLIFPEASPEHIVEADDALYAQCEHYRILQASISELEAQAEQVKTELLSAMGKADTLRFRGQTLATWKQSRPSQRLDLDALKAAHPALVAGFNRTVPGSRRFLLKAGSLTQQRRRSAQTLAATETSDQRAQVPQGEQSGNRQAQAAGKLPGHGLGDTWSATKHAPTHTPSHTKANTHHPI
jgi:hypothetical protein